MQETLNEQQLQKKYEELDKSKRPERAERVIRFLDKIGAYNFFQKLNKDKKRDINFDQFKSFLIRINGIVRDISKQERAFDGKNVEISGALGTVLPPRHEDKEELLEEAYDSSLKL